MAICGTFPAERIVGSWNSHPVAIRSATQRNLHICTSKVPVAAPLGGPSIEVMANSYPIRIAWKTALKPQSEHCILVKTASSGIFTVESRLFEATHQTTFASHGVINVLPSQQFRILLTKFFAKAMYLLKNMMVAYSSRPPTSVITASSTPLHRSPTGIPESVCLTTF